MVEQYAARREHRYSRKGASVRGAAAPISERHRTVATPAAACAASLPPLPQFVAPGVTTRRQAAAAAEDDQLLGDAVPDDDNDDLSSIFVARKKVQALIQQRLVETRESGVGKETPSHALTYCHEGGNSIVTVQVL